jgi:nucleotide-binding universal stress UspA family protein
MATNSDTTPNGDSSPEQARAVATPIRIGRVGVGVDPHREGRDAAVLAGVIAGAAHAEVMLLAVEPDLLLVIPGLNWKAIRSETQRMLTHTRDSLSPGARIKTQVDLSTARGLKRLVTRERCDLLTVGSSRSGPDGQVTIGHLTRQLFDQLECAVAIAPRALSHQPQLALKRIGVGFDGGAEARAALATAAAIAVGCGAELVVRGVIDDRVPALGWPHLWLGDFEDSWDDAISDEVEALRDLIELAIRGIETDVSIEVRRGKPGTSLLELSGEVDLLVIGSRRWGTLARVLLGGTGEALVHGARCSLLVVPRPPDR